MLLVYPRYGLKVMPYMFVFLLTAFFLGMSTVEYIFSIVIFHNCMSLFESTLLSYC